MEFVNFYYNYNFFYLKYTFLVILSSNFEFRSIKNNSVFHHLVCVVMGRAVVFFFLILTNSIWQSKDCLLFNINILTKHDAEHNIIQYDGTFWRFYGGNSSVSDHFPAVVDKYRHKNHIKN